MTKKSGNTILTMLAHYKRGYYLLFWVLLACQPQAPISNDANGEKVTQNSKNDNFVTNKHNNTAKIAPKTKNKLTNSQNTPTIADTVNYPFGEKAIFKQLTMSGMIDVQTILPNVKVDLRYSTTSNFVGTDLYGDLDECYLHPIAVKKLQLAQKVLSDSCFSCQLLLFDCARPLSVQKKLWQKVVGTPQQHYVAPPSRHSLHNYGMAVDITIFDESTQKMLDMGTKYDFLGSLAKPKYESKFLKSGQLTIQQVKNRRLLRSIMQQAGFRAIPNEWWHFDAVSLQQAKKQFSVLP